MTKENKALDGQTTVSIEPALLLGNNYMFCILTFSFGLCVLLVPSVCFYVCCQDNKQMIKNLIQLDLFWPNHKMLESKMKSW